MSEHTHTPGKWHFEAGVEDNEGEFYVCHPATVCDATTVCNTRNEADARVIAALPELLEALDFMVNVARATPGFSPMALKQGAAAIAHARGEG